MADSLSLTVRTLFDWAFVSTLDHSAVRDTTQLYGETKFVDGTDAGECNQLFHDKRSLAPGASEDINLLAVTVALFGGTITFGFDTVKALLFINNATTAGENFLIGGQGSNAWSGPFNDNDSAQLLVPAGGHLILCNPSLAGWDVGAGAYALRITNNGTTTNNYDIAVAGLLLTT